MIKRPDFVEFILEDTHSRVLRDYITLLENKINNATIYLNNRKDKQKIKDLSTIDINNLLLILKGDFNE